MHVESDVVVDEEDGASAMIPRIADVIQNPVKGIRVKVSPPHFDDGAEAAVVGAAARSLDYINLTAEQGVAPKHSGRTIGQTDFTVLESMHRTCWIAGPMLALAVGKA